MIKNKNKKTKQKKQTNKQTKQNKTKTSEVTKKYKTKLDVSNLNTCNWGTASVIPLVILSLNQY